MKPKDLDKEKGDNGEIDYFPDKRVVQMRLIDRLRATLAPIAKKVMPGEPGFPFIGFRPDNDPEYFKTGSIEGIDLVGPEKPMGYYPLPYENTTEENQKLATKYKEKGFKTLLIDSFLYVYDENALQKLLDKHKQLLDDVNWPDDAHHFVMNVGLSPYAKNKTPLFTLIAEAFGDKNNPGRTDIIFK